MKIEQLVEDPNKNPRAAVRVYEIKDEIKDLVKEALRVVQQTGDETAYERARRYWYAHIVMALDADHTYLGNGGHTMEDTVNELNQADEEHDQRVGLDDDEEEDQFNRVERERRDRLRRGTF